MRILPFLLSPLLNASHFDCFDEYYQRHWSRPYICHFVQSFTVLVLWESFSSPGRAAFYPGPYRKSSRAPIGSGGFYLVRAEACFQPTLAPGFTSREGEATTRLPSASTALRIIPSESTPLSLRGSKLAMKSTCFPTRSSGL